MLAVKLHHSIRLSLGKKAAAADTLRLFRKHDDLLVKKKFKYNCTSYRFYSSQDDDDHHHRQKNPQDDDIVEIVQSDSSDNAVKPLKDGENAPQYPHVLAVPTIRRPMFPGVVLPMTITNSDLSRSLLAQRDSGQPYVGMFLRKSGVEKSSSGNDPEIITDISQIHSIGTFARIDNIIPFDGSATQVLMIAHRRIRIDEIHDLGPPFRVKISHLENEPYDEDSEMIKAYSNEIVAILRDVVKLNPLFKEHMQYFSQRIDINNPYKLADFAASVTSAKADHLQSVLEELNCEKRLRRSLELITQELELSKVQQSIKAQVEEKVSKNQRRYFLMEQLKVIKQELGMEKDDKEALTLKFRDRLSQVPDIPEEVTAVIEEELDKLSMLEKNSSEFNVTRNYLDWLTQLPWGKNTDENFDIEKAKAILHEDHYGLSDIKDRILEFIAVSKLKASVQGKILCLVGPPGVGKTSIGHSIARALNREFFRFSVGGMSDVAEIKGHRRTYVGAMPGKIIQCLKSTQTSNPVVLIDEIDKLGKGYQGDPASALLELLDPGQNKTFLDHYMDVPVDLSKILFICTANVMDSIPGPLQDRMEILRLSGYDSPEKLEIAQQYLEPKARAACGLTHSDTVPSTLHLSEDAMKSLIRWYCREAGVRSLEQHIEKIYRKVALEYVSCDPQEIQSKNWQVTEENLNKYVGKPKFTSDRLYEKVKPGIVMGLAWTAMGGTSLYIETTTIHQKEGKGSLVTTGQMGNVMEESTRIAHTYARHMLAEYDSKNKFFDTSDIHMHIPEGATPKDGPSAGCTMVTALLSLAMNRSVKDDLAMTGEISLTGKVLPVGGIKEKTIAARRSGVRCLILPEANRRDFEELPDYLKKDLDVHFANYYSDVFQVAFE